MKYEVPTPQVQVAMVLDLNKCLGCHTCTIACKKLWNSDQGTDYAYWNNVETMPGKGYPAHYPDTGGRTATRRLPPIRIDGPRLTVALGGGTMSSPTVAASARVIRLTTMLR